MTARSTVCILAILLGLPTVSSASVFDDASAWWHFDFANSGSITTAGDIRDQRAWETAGGATATTVVGTPEWTSSGLPSADYGPGGGQIYGNRALRLLPAVAGLDVTADGFEVNGFSMGGNASLVARFKWDGYPTAEETAWLYFNGFDFGANQGWMFGLNGATGSPNTLFGSVGGVSSSWTTTPGTWYDVAVVISDNVSSDNVTFYRWTEGGAFESQSFNTDKVNGVTGPNRTQVGYEAPGPDSGNAPKSFSGTIDHLAVWNRALTANEIHDAFGAPNNEWQIGIDNNSVEDLRFEGAGNTNYTIGDPWHEMPRALSVSNSVPANNVNFTLSAAEADLNHVFHVNIDGTSGGTKNIKVLLNGNDLGTQSVGGGDNSQWIVNRQFLNPGSNTLTIQEVGFGGGEYVTWDWMEFGGAWQIGSDDGSQSDFGSEHSTPTDFYVTNPNAAQVERAIGIQDGDDLDNLVRLNFNLSDTLANLDYLFKTEVIAQSQAGGNPFDVLVNGSVVQSFAAQPDGTTIAVYISGSLLNAGNNSIALAFTGTSGNFTQFDYYQLQVVPEPSSLGLMAMAGAMIAYWRRRRGMME